MYLSKSAPDNLLKSGWVPAAIALSIMSCNSSEVFTFVDVVSSVSNNDYLV